MGFGISVATAIIAIGLILTATVHYERVSNSCESLRDARDEKHAMRLSELDTAIGVYSTSQYHYEDQGGIANTSGSDNFYIKNTGTTSIDKADLIVLVNGASDSFNPELSGWAYPGDGFQATLDLDIGDDVKIVTANGRSAHAGVV
uniref:Archaeal Type IV pilin N-terminal domain-containing protein n=1 Tax=Candidatus Methanogaster sp. ANME-2c ERB4 TaxID=2759911 RepID=A0A7G9YI65_9EURY|nr:hypothetical protein FJIOJMEM_00025 [Methanosarcinales archaeon ANME-2c ERB4]